MKSRTQFIEVEGLACQEVTLDVRKDDLVQFDATFDLEVELSLALHLPLVDCFDDASLNPIVCVNRGPIGTAL